MNPFLPLAAVHRAIDPDWQLAATERLWKAERGQTFRHCHATAALAEQLLRDAGLERVERIAHPADGRTVYLDRRTPLAWDASRATLTLLTPAGLFADPVLASYERHPFHLVKGSTATPTPKGDDAKDGVVARLRSERQLFAGHDGRGGMVLLEPDNPPRDASLQAILDLGALGFVTDHVVGRLDTPDALGWYNAATEGAHWHVQAEDRPFIGFAVSPRVGERLRAALRGGPGSARVFSDARRYEGEWHSVTGVIPGEDAREVWLTAHLYEPMPDDNSAGVAGSIEIARTLRRLIAAGELPRPRFTLRLVFSAEMYGFAAFAHGFRERHGPLRERVLGAVNYDSPCAGNGGRLYLAPPCAPFFGDPLLEDLRDEHHASGRPFHITTHEAGALHDDQFLGDPRTGVPTVWLLGHFDWWHNSAQDMRTLDREAFARHTAIYAAWLARVLNLRQPQREAVLRSALRHARRHIQDEAAAIAERAANGDDEERARVLARVPAWMAWRCEREEARLRDFARVWDSAELDEAAAEIRRECERAEAELIAPLGPLTPQGHVARPEAAHVEGRIAPMDPVRDQWASGVVVGRTVPWAPYDQANAPKAERRPLPDRVIYGPFGTVLARADGRRSVKDLVEYAEWVHGTRIGAGQLTRYLAAIDRLGERGDLAVTRAWTVTRQQIAAALRQVGVVPGDVALVHSSMSKLGPIAGGAEAVIDALLDALGPRGTLLVPAFTNSSCYCDGLTAGPSYRPFDRCDRRVWVGRVPAALLGRPGVFRSEHPTHSVAGVGPLAHELLEGHREADAPTGATSPFARLAPRGAKMVWLGADLASTTYLHYLEDAFDLPYLGPAVAGVRRADGRVELVAMPRWLPGCRDFYRSPGETTKVYRRMLERGLTIRAAALGIGQVKLIDAGQMHELGSAVLREEPWALLCDRPECAFCRRFTK